jgi:hypothetical protein
VRRAETSRPTPALSPEGEEARRRREERLARALRANLLRRKARARQLGGGTGEEDSGGDHEA